MNRHILTLKHKHSYLIFVLLPLFLFFIFPVIFFNKPLFFRGYLTALNQSHLILRTNYPINTYSLFLTLFGVLLWSILILTTFSFQPTEKSRFLRFNIDFSKKTYLTFMLLEIIILNIHFFYNIPSSLKQLLYPFSLLPTIFSVISLYQIKRKQHKNFFKIIIIINFLLVSFIAINEKMTTPLFYFLVTTTYVVFFIENSTKKKVYHIAITIFVAIALCIFVKNISREISGFYQYKLKRTLLSYIKHQELNQQNTGGSKRGNHLFFPPTGPLKYPYYIMYRILQRIDHFTIFAHVINTTPNKKPYLYGKTYRTLIYSFIPRALWHNKPIDHNGNFLGRRYDLVDPRDTNGSWGLSIPAEAFANFGWMGLIVSALLFGLFLRLIFDYFIGEDPKLSNIVIASIVIFNTAQGESGANIAIGNTIHCLMFYLPLLWILQKWQEKRQKVITTIDLTQPSASLIEKG